MYNEYKRQHILNIKYPKRIISFGRKTSDVKLAEELKFSDEQVYS